MWKCFKFYNGIGEIPQNVYKKISNLNVLVESSLCINNMLIKSEFKN